MPLDGATRGAPDGPISALRREYELGRDALARDDYKKAVRILTRAVGAFSEPADCDADLAVVLCARSTALFYAGKLADALRDADAVVQKRPTWSKVRGVWIGRVMVDQGFFRRGEVLAAQEKWAEAIESFTRAQSLEADARSLDVLALRILSTQQRADATAGGMYFRQLLPGRDICQSTFNPIRKIVFQFARGMQNIVYAIGDRASGECMLVDACWDTDGILAVLKRDAMRPVGCIVTHNHFDHVGGRPPPPFRSYGVSVGGVKDILKRFPQIPVYIHKDDADAFQNDSGVDPERIRATDDGTTVQIAGTLTLKFIHTPGHTPGSQCVLVDGGRLLTGDTLFPGSCGRMDLPGGCVRETFETLQRRLGAHLRAETVVYPGHSYSGQLISTIGRERERGLLRSMSLDEWMHKMAPRPAEDQSSDAGGPK